MDIAFPNIRHLRAFREVVRLHGISAAAEAVHLSQPAVTQAIAGLEARLDTPLFDRRPEGMFPTEEGALFAARVTVMFDLLDQGAIDAVRQAGRRDDQTGARADETFPQRVTAAQLRALVAIGDHGSFSLAARATGVSQPSIHRAGRDLEKLAGIALFAPDRKGVDLTPAAELFARAVKLAASELRQGFSELSARRGRDSTTITVGSLPLSRSSILPRAIHGLLAGHAGVQLRNVDGPYDELLKGLRHGDLDLLIGALRDPVPTDDVAQEPLFDDPLALFVGPSHPLAERRGIRLQDTLDFPWIAPPATTPAGSYLYRTLKIDALPQTPVRIVSSSMVMVRGLLMQGDYVTILSQHQTALEQAQGVMVALPITLPDSARPIGLTTRKGWTPTPTQARFLALIRAAAQEGL
ncbi:LysR family transcriptional regulator [Aliiroseovarius subalbicans]|uniref:LysR family transcriptional regulator n=1 Tax=Aliiroseovarius subalbicans TaxID=2925840 RepID=UPI001F5A3AC4|nr:LysR family transcriptional regulator [Aliiroseovarius subalbicans]MCI2399217.1 LysR family transcriptional regulator [Aliiroseovarius subalbicans]